MTPPATNNAPDGGARPLSTEERLRQKKQGDKKEQPSQSFLQHVRGYADALVLAYLLAMFIRSFVFELFMIPTGSMTPTLIGDSAGEVAFYDYDEDGIEDVVYTFRASGSRILTDLQVFLMNQDGTYKDLIFIEGVPPDNIRQLAASSTRRTDMIIVNKFAYWFSKPERGDIAVFKVPYRPEREGVRWEIDKPVYIKRVVGLPGEELIVQPSNLQVFGPGDPNRYGNRLGGREIHLLPKPMLADGKPIDDGSMGHLIHFPRHSYGRGPMPHPSDPANVELVPADGVLMLGDNAASSSDGRYWGHVPLDHLRGKALFRYMPWKGFGFLDRNRSHGAE